MTVDELINELFAIKQASNVGGNMEVQVKLDGSIFVGPIEIDKVICSDKEASVAFLVSKKPLVKELNLKK
ncbi:hypothetical protein [Runella salmonicolor]|uniref:Uncharacterized protein n=1 Tax=Runella salmonicolor TaxID=2950278 RepID=A0ABT1FSU5_9BACT|nr:hypothetical protein [Runella salmonicolor]MCP1384835.1 hypothetical protein [Runella salmonicolor]